MPTRRHSPSKKYAKIAGAFALIALLGIVVMSAGIMVKGKPLDIISIPTASITGFTPDGSQSDPTIITTSNPTQTFTCNANADVYGYVLNFHITITDAVTGSVLVNQQVPTIVGSNGVSQSASYALQSSAIGNSVHLYEVQWTITENGPVTATGYFTTVNPAGGSAPTGTADFSSIIYGQDCQATLSVPTSSPVATDINGQTTPCNINLPVGTYTVTATTMKWNDTTQTEDTYTAQASVTVTQGQITQCWIENGWSDVAESGQVGFTESGLLGGTQWSVTCDGSTISSTTDYVGFSDVPIGSFTYSFSSVSGYNTPSSGTGTLTSTSSIAVTYTKIGSSNNNNSTAGNSTNNNIAYLDINAATGGTTDPTGQLNSTGSDFYVTAIPASGYEFNTWILNGQETMSSNTGIDVPAQLGTTQTLTPVFQVAPPSSNPQNQTTSNSTTPIPPVSPGSSSSPLNAITITGAAMFAFGFIGLIATAVASGKSSRRR